MSLFDDMVEDSQLIPTQVRRKIVEDSMSFSLVAAFDGEPKDPSVGFTVTVYSSARLTWIKDIPTNNTYTKRVRIVFPLVLIVTIAQFKSRLNPPLHLRPPEETTLTRRSCSIHNIVFRFILHSDRWHPLRPRFAKGKLR